MPEPIRETEWLSQARAIFTTFYGPAASPLVVTIADEAGQRVRLSIPVSSPSPPGTPAPQLSPAEAEILHALGAATLMGKTIARRLGKPGNSSLKVILSNLVERGVLARTPDGYRRANLLHP